MGYFKNIKLRNYRNFLDSSLNFDANCNIIIGKNGSGKTNILESISLFEKGRGFKKEKILNLINFEKKFFGFDIKSSFQDQKIDLNINIFNSDKNLKRLSVNGSIEKESIKYFESLFSVIYFLPEMERLFISTPSLRRNFLDRLIYNFDKEYNIIVNKYKKAVSERQLLLKKNLYDNNWIKEIECLIVEFGLIIYKKRSLHVDTINKILQKLNLTTHFSNNFILRIKDDFYDCCMKADSKELYILELKNNREVDLYSGGCTIGPHRSDLEGFNQDSDFNLNQLSTGQQKTIVLMMIIAQCKYLIENLKLNPIILLDEVCSHLDNVNRDLLLYLVDALKVQVFMTGTEENFFSFLSTKANYCNIQQ